MADSHTYSRLIIEVGVEEALKEVSIVPQRFQSRGTSINGREALPKMENGREALGMDRSGPGLYTGWAKGCEPEGVPNMSTKVGSGPMANAPILRGYAG